MNFNPDNIVFFYLTIAIVGLAFALIIVFGKTEDKKKNKAKS